MRAFAALIPVLLIASPAAAQPKGEIEIPPELTDPAMADKLGRMAGALTKAMMDLPVGELEAAVEGREPTPADRQRRVRDHVGATDAERDVEAKVAASGRTMQAATKALVDSLPSLMAALEETSRRLERATANLPDPTYPRR